MNGLVHWLFLELCPKLCTCTSLDSNLQLCAFKHRNSPFELFFKANCLVPFTAGGLGPAQGPQKLWDKWCKILHSRPLLALNFIIETSFFLYYFSHILFYILLITKSSISNTMYSVCIYWSACLRLQIFTNKHRYISSNPIISRYFLLIRGTLHAIQRGIWDAEYALICNKSNVYIF
jgi:hypothetical protein